MLTIPGKVLLLIGVLVFLVLMALAEAAKPEFR
jgi:hypothetical protein